MTTPINPLPTPPSPADSPTDFNTKAFALLGALPAFVTEANAQASGLDAAVASAGVEADAAALKAGEALASANNAAISKTGADSARDAAVIAQNAAEAALDSFAARYLGAKAVAPTTDNDGAALLPGALYWDTVLGAMRAWSGSVWVTLPATTAAAISNTPAGSIAATTVQAAINELDTEKVSLTGDQTIAGTKTFSSFPVLPMPGDLFRKADSSTVVFTKTGAGTAQIKAGTLIDVGGTTITFAAATAITMPALTAGTDYAIYACTDGTVRADASFSVPSGYTTANSRKIGGFHYAPGGNAPAQAGGDTTPAINAYSFWDLKFKPSCPDPRGMTLVANGFWADIYLTGLDHYTNGTSKYNVTIADGSSPPKVPALFGGNGSTAYTTYTWWEAGEVLRSHGKRLPTYDEFAALAYGTTEASSGGTDPVSTILRAAYTSKFGVMLATGNLWQWGAEFGGGAGTAAWADNTGGRGSTYQLENAALFGGDWGETSSSGSRCSFWLYSPAVSPGVIGSRAVCDLLILE